MLSKIYLEITNICNLSCKFCPKTKREKRFMTTDEFTLLAEKLVGKTKYLYLHLMGEPLLHPNLPEIIDIASSLGFFVCITTNGTLLPKVGKELIRRADKIYKISISLHSFEANPEYNCETYYSDCIEFQKNASKAGIITVLRLWNLDGEKTKGDNKNNRYILSAIGSIYNGEWQQNRGGVKLSENAYLEFADRFEWPSLDAPDYGETRRCMGLKDQCGILCDGSVVPCCLDSEGNLTLGNLFENGLDEILMSDTALTLKNGFRISKAKFELCRKCEYSLRFINR